MAGRAPVKTGAHRDIERSLGAPTLRESDTGEEPPDLDELPPGWKSRYTEHREAQAVERRTRSKALRSSSAPAPRSRPAPSGRAHTGPANRSRRRPTGPSLANPTGGRLPVGFDGDGLAGVFFGAIFYALVINVANYGAAGPGLWFKAKFLNQPAPPKGGG